MSLEPPSLPPPPPGRSPTLAMSRFTPAGQRVATIAFISAFFIFFALGYHYFRDVSWPWIAGIFGPGLWIVLSTALTKNTTAGSDWVCTNATWVCTTELVRVRIYVTTAGTQIELRDRDERQLNCRLSDLTDSLEVWELFRAGLTASLAAGLDPNERTRRVLRLGASEASARSRRCR